jgi:A/G-specific adenine glycosylase
MERLKMRAWKFRLTLLKWYRRNGRDLPWRQTRDPYRILVSEFMLQQTQVATVQSYYATWVRRFPNFTALARASQSEVLSAWQGLGYYARARNIHATAKLVRRRYRGRFPTSIDEMRKLPGVGRYTAHAVATFAFDQAVPIVEANSARVLARLFDMRSPIDSTRGQTQLWSHAAKLLPKKSSAIYNSALLDLGALVCLPRSPKCNVCPVSKFCRAKNPHTLPIKRPRAATRQLVERHAFATKDNRVMLSRANQRWRGMWILPALNDAAARGAAIYQAIFPFTNHRIILQAFPAPPPKIDRDHRWFSKRQLARAPIPSPHRRAIEQLFLAA